jgi:hypothetical protein
MLPLLALLLSAGTRISDGMKLARGADATIQFSKLEERVLAELGKGRFNIEACAVLPEDRVGVLDVSARECLDGILESREAGDDLCPH